MSLSQRRYPVSSTGASLHSVVFGGSSVAVGDPFWQRGNLKISQILPLSAEAPQTAARSRARHGHGRRPICNQEFDSGAEFDSRMPTPARGASGRASERDERWNSAGKGMDIERASLEWESDSESETLLQVLADWDASGMVGWSSGRWDGGCRVSSY